MDEINDETLKQLLRRALNGDNRAAETAFGALWIPATRSARRCLRIEEDVQDAVSNLFLSCIERPEKFINAHDTKAYFCSSAYYGAQAYAKKMRRSKLVITDEVPEDPESVAFGGHATNARVLAGSREAAQVFAEAFATVREPQRKQAILHYVNDYVWEEVGYITANDPEAAGRIRVAVFRELKTVAARIAPKLGIKPDGIDVGESLRHAGLPPAPAPEIEPAARRQLTLFVNDPEALPESDRAIVQRRLDEESPYRHLKVILDRNLDKASDVRAHVPEELIPAAIMARILHAVHEKTA